MARIDAAPEILRIGDFTLDVARAELSGPGGRVPLRPQSFQVLLLLIRHAGRLVTKQELYSAIWADRAVTDDSLTQCLIDIRKALGDRERKIIRTVPRRGYMFVGDVAAGPAVEAPGPRKHSLATSAGALFVVLMTALLWRLYTTPNEPDVMEDSIAVMPFVDLGAYEVDQYVGDGLAENILISLGQYPGLRVIARTSTFARWARAADIRQIRETLKVEYVLEGSVRRDGQEFRVVANLVESSRGTQLWSETYTVGQQELATIQGVVSGAVADKIAPGQASTASRFDPASLSDIDLVWLARRYEDEVREQQQVDSTRLNFAIKLYRDAIEANPASALAHSRLAGALLYGGDVDSAEVHVMEALKLDPDLSEVQESLGRYYWAKNLPEAAGDAWQRAIDLNPSNVNALSAYASWRWVSKDTVTPGELYRRALELDPLNLSRYADLGFFVGSNSDIEGTEDIIGRVEALFDGAEAYLLIAELLDFAGRIDESFAWVIRARELEPDNRLHTEALAELYVDIGDFETALGIQPEPGPGILLKMQRYDDFIREARLRVIDDSQDVHLRYLLAHAYNVNGQPGEARRIFEELGLLRDPTGPMRQIIDVEARVILADTVHASGDLTHAREIAEWWADSEHMGGPDWWIHFYLACTYAIADRKEKALDEIERIPESPRLPWTYLLQDAPCLTRFAAEPRYLAAVRKLEERKATLRERLPQTLRELGVTPPTR